MSVNDLIARYEGEKADIKEKIQTLRTREEFVEVLLKELKIATRGMGGKAARKPAKRRGRPKKRSGTTVREAIIKAVAGAGDAITAGAIIAEAVKLSGGAEASIRTQINTLTKEGQLKQVPYEGRGFKYAIPGRSEAKPAKKAATRKPRRKKAAPKAAKAPAK